MPRRQKKETDLTNSNDALTLLRLQQQVLTLTTAKAALEDVHTRPTPPDLSYWCVRGERSIQGHPLVATRTSCLLTGICRRPYHWCHVGVLCYWRFWGLVSLHRLVLCGAFVPIWDALFGHQGHFISCRNCSGWSTNACASLSGRLRTIAISIAPPSCWNRGGRPSWSLSKIATALFSHIVRSHSSSARQVRAAFCGGACSLLGLPRLCAKRLFGGLAWWRFCSSRTVWSSTSSETSLERVTFRLM